jgi:putative membrane protein
MIHTDDAFSDAVAARVTAIERCTDAEIVVVAAPRSGRYADVTARGASVVALAAAGVLLAIPWAIGEAWFLVDVGLTWLIAERLLRHRCAIRALTRSTRRTAQVRAAAIAEFHRESVHGTPRRTGVLVYLSVLEARVEIVPDLGVEGAVPRGALATVEDVLRADATEPFLQGLDALGAVLARHLPHRGDSDETDLPDAPRIRR